MIFHLLRSKKKENKLLRKKRRVNWNWSIPKRNPFTANFGEDLKQVSNRQEVMLKGQKNQQQTFRELREQMYNSCLNFYLNTEEIKKGTRYQSSFVPCLGC